MTASSPVTAATPTKLMFRSSRLDSVGYTLASLGCMFIGWLLLHAPPSRRFPQIEVEFAGWAMIAVTAICTPLLALSIWRPVRLVVEEAWFRISYAHRPSRNYKWRNVERFWRLAPNGFIVWSFNDNSILCSARKYDGYLPSNLKSPGIDLCDLMNEKLQFARTNSAAEPAQ